MGIKRLTSEADIYRGAINNKVKAKVRSTPKAIKINNDCQETTSEDAIIKEITTEIRALPAMAGVISMPPAWRVITKAAESDSADKRALKFPKTVPPDKPSTKINPMVKITTVVVIHVRLAINSDKKTCPKRAANTGIDVIITSVLATVVIWMAAKKEKLLIENKSAT